MVSPYLFRMSEAKKEPVQDLPKIIGRTRRLTSHHRVSFDRIFHSGGGYVLDFSDRTMSEWFEETLDLDIF